MYKYLSYDVLELLGTLQHNSNLTIIINDKIFLKNSYQFIGNMTQLNWYVTYNWLLKNIFVFIYGIVD